MAIADLLAENPFNLPTDLARVWELPVPPPPLLLRPGIVIRNTRSPDVVDAYVPLDLIRTEDLPVDDLQMEILGRDFDYRKAQGHETGQLDPVGLVLLRGDNEGFDIHNGFHRSNLLKRRHEERAYTSITINSRMDQLIDLRRIAATPHHNVKCPRMVSIFKSEWAQTVWAQRGIKITQAFQLVVNKNVTGARMGFTSREDAENAASLVINNCNQWGVYPATAYGWHLTEAVADPELFFGVRERRGGHKLEALTPDHLEAIAKASYNDKSFAGRFDMQRVVSEVVLEHKLNVPNTRALMRAVIDTEDPDEVRRIIEEGAWKEGLRLTRAPRMRKQEIEVSQAMSSPDGLAVQLAEAIIRAQTAEGERDERVSQLEELRRNHNVTDFEARLATVSEGYEVDMTGLKTENERLLRENDQLNSGNINLANENRNLRAENRALKETRATATNPVQPRPPSQPRATRISARAVITGSTSIPENRRDYSAFTRREETESDLPNLEGPDMEGFLTMPVSELGNISVDLLKFTNEIPVSFLSRDRIKAIRFMASGSRGFDDYHVDEIGYLRSDDIRRDLSRINKYLAAHPEHVTLSNLLNFMIKAYNAD